LVGGLGPWAPHPKSGPELAKLIATNSTRISYEKNKAAVSSGWSDFVKVNDHGSFCQHIKCVKCGILLKWKKRDGTSGLSNHSYAKRLLLDN